MAVTAENFHISVYLSDSLSLLLSGSFSCGSINQWKFVMPGTQMVLLYENMCPLPAYTPARGCWPGGVCKYPSVKHIPYTSPRTPRFSRIRRSLRIILVACSRRHAVTALRPSLITRKTNDSLNEIKKKKILLTYRPRFDVILLVSRCDTWRSLGHVREILVDS